MLTLFPFEAEFYNKHQVAVTCVGHPIADEIESPNKQIAREKLGVSLNAEQKLIALLPGSRRSEVSKLAPLLIEAAKMLHKKHCGIEFILPFANKKMERVFNQVAAVPKGIPVRLIHGEARLAMEASDVIVLASGTAALEAALLRRPHVVIYKLNAITAWLVRRLKHVTHYSMPNNLLEAPIVPELVQEHATSENIYHEVNKFLTNPLIVQELEGKFATIHKKLKKNANRQASIVVKKLLRING